MMGPRVLHGPAPGRPQVDDDGDLFERSRTAASNVASVTSVMTTGPYPVRRSAPPTDAR